MVVAVVRSHRQHCDMAGLARVEAQLGAVSGVSCFMALLASMHNGTPSFLLCQCACRHMACLSSILCPQHKTRDVMAKAGLPTPRHYRIEKVREAGSERPPVPDICCCLMLHAYRL